MTVGASEQDDAAGGRGARELLLPGGVVAIASVSIRQFRRTPTRRYAYLQFKHEGKTVTRYIGLVSAASREESLQEGWATLRRRQLVEAYGWQWVGRAPKSRR